MKKLILIAGMITAISGCSAVSNKAKQDLRKPIHCATAEGDIRSLKSEKAHTSAKIAAGVEAILPISLVVNVAKGKEGETMSVASGKYNKMIDNKIADIQSECGIK
jgi:hypothetical protein